MPKDIFYLLGELYMSLVKYSALNVSQNERASLLQAC